MTAGWDAVLSVLGPDLPPLEWARRIGCSAREVRETAVSLGVRLGGTREVDVMADAMRTIREVECG